ncbi:hypothetical protein DSO57_1008808 [Entomophthora muscae]|uniref:Uncharacterized protein n=1 Tax=Entomophthora muscae TaxID=34485 RepID=A0ACC2USW2_9FUNG|nr:hypothetical protein DSO57_1008808 [Entomophthora muscae]
MKLCSGLLVNAIQAAWVSHTSTPRAARQADQGVYYRGHFIENLEANNAGTYVEYLPPDAKTSPDSDFDIVTMDDAVHSNEVNSRYDDLWDIHPYHPPVEYCEAEYLHKTRLEALTDDYADLFGIIYDLDVVEKSANDAAAKLVETQFKTLTSGLEKNLFKVITEKIPEDRIDIIDFYYNEAKSVIDAASTDAKEELTAIHAVAKRRIVNILIQRDPTSEESARPGLKAHNLKLQVQRLENLLDSATASINHNSETFRAKASSWYYGKLDEQYKETLAQEEELEKRVAVVMGGM